MYIYQGRIPLSSVKGKQKRLLDLLHEFAAMLIPEIVLRRPNLNDDDLSKLSKIRIELQEKRGGFNMGKEDLVTLEKLLNMNEYSECQTCYRMKNPNTFKGMWPENKVEMIFLLQDNDCAEIRKTWEKIFFAHNRHTIRENIEYGFWNHIDDSIIWGEAAWMFLAEEGNYSDLFLYYVPEVAEDVEPAEMTEEIHPGEEEASPHQKLGSFPSNVYQKQGKGASSLCHFFH